MSQGGVMLSVRKSLHYSLFTLVLGFATGAVYAASESPPQVTAITNVTIIDAVNAVRPSQTVVFSGDEITAVLPADSDFEATQIIDGTGKYLIPGLWDFHVHLSYEPALTPAMSELFLAYGITSVRDTGGLLSEVLPVVESMRAEESIAPRVFYAGPLLDGQHVVYDGNGRPEIGIQIESVEEAQVRVRELHEQGVSFIKVYEMVSPEVFAALVATANELDLPIDSHVPLSMRARVAGAQVSSIEHLRNIEMDCAADAEALHTERLERLANPDNLSGADLRASLHSLQRLPAVANYDAAECDTVIAALAETVMVPTLRLNSFNLSPAWERNDFEDALLRLPAAVLESWRSQAALRSSLPAGDTRFAEWSLFLTQRMHEAGVPIGAGTDTPINLSVPGYSLHSELQMLVQAGLTPLEALEAATLVPARYFSLEDRMGSVDVGKVADMVLLNADPLEDIFNARIIDRVVSQGRIIR